MIPTAEYDPIDKSQFDFGRLIQGIFQDTQKKLVASAQVVLKTSIMQYVPTFEDLDYPPKVPAKEDSKSNMPVPTEVNDGQGISGGFDTDTVFQGWYPTLRKAIWLLSRIYRLVNVGGPGNISSYEKR